MEQNRCETRSATTFNSSWSIRGTDEIQFVRDYEYGDIEKIHDPKEPGEFQDWQIAEYTNYTKTILHGEKVVAVIGIVKMWNGVGQGFVITSASYKGGIRYLRTTAQHLIKGMGELGLWRVQTYIDESWLESARFAKLLKLKHEAVLKKMSPDGADLSLYARVE